MLLLTRPDWKTDFKRAQLTSTKKRLVKGTSGLCQRKAEILGKRCLPPPLCPFSSALLSIASPPSPLPGLLPPPSSASPPTISDLICPQCLQSSSSLRVADGPPRRWYHQSVVAIFGGSRASSETRSPFSRSFIGVDSFKQVFKQR